MTIRKNTPKSVFSYIESTFFRQRQGIRQTVFVCIFLKNRVLGVLPEKTSINLDIGQNERSKNSTFFTFYSKILTPHPSQKLF